MSFGVVANVLDLARQEGYAPSPSPLLVLLTPVSASPHFSFSVVEGVGSADQSGSEKLRGTESTNRIRCDNMLVPAPCSHRGGAGNGTLGSSARGLAGD